MKAINVNKQSFWPQQKSESRIRKHLMGALKNGLGLLICLMFLSANQLQAQGSNPGPFSISGATNVDEGDTETYTLSSSNSTGVSFITWFVSSNGTKLSETLTTVTVRWNTAGTGTIQANVTDNTIRSNQYVVDAPNVTINTSLPPPTPPATPDTPQILSFSCGGAVLGVTSPPTGFVTWYWQGTNPNGTSTAQSAATDYSVSASGTYYLRAYHVRDALWSTSSSSVSVTIPEDAGTITVTGISSRCKGSGSDDFNASSTGGATNFTWTLSPSAAGSIDTNGNVTWSSSFSGTATIKAEIANPFCGNVSDTQTVTVYEPVGDVTISGGVTTRCQGSGTTDYNASASGGTGFNWSIFPASAGSINSSGTVTWSAGFSGTATIAVAATGAGSCRNTADSEIVTVTPTIGTVSITGSNERCQGGGTTDYNASAANATGFSWSISPTAAGSINSAGLVTWNSNFSGTATVSVAASNSCFTKNATRNVTVNPLVGATTISGSDERCQGSGTTDYNATAANATNFTWSLSPSSAGTINSSGTVTWSAGFNGTATVSVNSSNADNCNVTTDSHSVTVTPLVGAVSFSPHATTRCQGAGTTDYNASASNASSYTWSISPAAAGTINNSGTVSWSASFSGDAVIIATANGCTSQSASTIIEVTEAYDYVAIIGTTSRCQGVGTDNYFATPEGATSVSWSVSPTAAGSINNSGLLTWNSSFSGTATVSVTASNGCGSATNSRNVVVTPNITSVDITGGVTERCQSGGTTDFNASVSGASTYAWSISPSAAGSINSSGLVTWSSSFSGTATVSVTASNECGSASDSHSVAVHPAVTGATITGGVSARWQGSGSTNFDALPASAATADWTLLPASAGTINAAGVVTWSAGFTGVATVRVGLSDLCQIHTDEKIVDVIARPEIIVTGDPNLCKLGQTVTLSPNRTYDSYSWKKDGIAVGNSSSLVVTEAGSYTLLVTIDGLTDESAAVTVSGSTSLELGDYNYVVSTDVLVEEIENVDDVDDLSIAERSVSVGYLDGLGRPWQTVAVEATPDQRHLVQPFEYDELGRETKKYLPYAADDCSIFQANPLGVSQMDYTSSPQYQFYQSEANVAHDVAPFAVSILEYSPLNRVLKQGHPGESWQPIEGSTADHVIDVEYQTNIANEVRAFGVVNGDMVSATVSGYYDAGTLFKVTTKDEDQKETQEFTDKAGRVVLKRIATGIATDPWADTYYVYDDYGNLSFVLPPEGTKDLIANGINTAGLDKWAFQYLYDKHNRNTDKKVPGGGWQFLLYDQVDRLAAIQDAEQRANSENITIRFNKYDAQNRIVLTGNLTDALAFPTGLANQISLDAILPSYTVNEKISSASGNILGYTQAAIPTNNTVDIYESATYYDDYTNLPSGFGLSFNYEIHTEYNQKVRGQVVGAQTKTLDGTETWLKSVIYYDDEYRVIQTQTENLLGGVDRVSSEYDFAGRVIKTISTHNAGPGSTDITVTETFTYDHASRLLEATHQIGTESEIILVSNEYNALGELIDKKLHSADDGAAFEQSVDYAYNIRGWLNKVNDADLSDNEGDFFGMELTFDKHVSGLNNDQLYNGNISGAKWSNFSRGIGMESGYKYLYDAMNRLTKANYKRKPIGNGWGNVLDFDVSLVAYDLNGNITRMKRFDDNTSSPMDNLFYTYDGNRLVKVQDNGKDLEGFVDGNTSGNDYKYDENGNMTEDANKDITSISYNHLNLPDTVVFTGNRMITYVYDAAGKKLAKTVDDDGTITTTDYVGGFIYEDGVLQHFPHAEGRVRLKSTGGYAYDYFLKDHLGNTRVTFSADKPVITYRATMENELGNDEESYFLNIATQRVVNVAANKTGSNGSVTGNEVVRLNGSDANRRLGPGKMLAVMAGDKVDLETYAYYEGTPGNNSPIDDAIFAALIGNAFGGNATGTEGQQAIQNGFENNLSMAVPSSADVSNTNIKAYLNYILFNNNFDAVDAGFVRVDQGVVEGNHRLLQMSNIAIEQTGFLYVYVSNEMDKDFNVYFDELEITHTSGGLLQEDHYYPFGMNIQGLSSTAPLSVPNQFKYNGFEEQTEFGLGWYDYMARNYDPQLGRFMQVDPLADLMTRMTPYAYAFNNPIRFIDPDGMKPEDKVTKHNVLEQDFEIGEGGETVSTTITEQEVTHTSQVVSRTLNDDGTITEVSEFKTEVFTTTSTIDRNGKIISKSGERITTAGYKTISYGEDGKPDNVTIEPGSSVYESDNFTTGKAANAARAEIIVGGTLLGMTMYQLSVEHKAADFVLKHGPKAGSDGGFSQMDAIEFLLEANSRSGSGNAKRIIMQQQIELDKLQRELSKAK